MKTTANDNTAVSRLSLRARLLLMMAVVVAAGLSLTLAVLMREAGQQQQAAAQRYTQELAQRSGNTAAQSMQQGLEIARAMAATISVMQRERPDRALGEAVLSHVQEQNPGLIGVWTGWEPDAFDGRDKEFANTRHYDDAGRYVPYVSRTSTGGISLTALMNYDKPGPGDYYQQPKASGKNTVLEPYPYTIDGKTMMITSMATPILRNGRFVGVAGVDLALDDIQQQVQAIRLYDSGYASLFSHAGIYVGDRDAERIGKPLDGAGLGMDGSQLAALRQAMQQGQPYTTEVRDPRLGVQALYVQVPIHFEGLDDTWAFAAVVPTDEVLKDLRALQWKVIALGLCSIVITCLVLALGLERLVLRPIGGEPGDAAALAQRVAKGNLSESARLRQGDSSSLMFQLQHMQEGLQRVVAQVREGAHSVATASAQIAMGNQDLSGRTESQASALEETAASMEQVGSTVQQNAEHARHASQLAQQATSVANQGGTAVAQVVQTMHGIRSSSERIADIIGVIDSIAFQTNILALNAAVEAARAGEQGRGFAVVASEVRTLAQRSSEAAKEIRQLILASAEQVTQGVGQVDDTKNTITQVVQSIEQVSALVREISTASHEQSSGVTQVGEAVAQMDLATQQNAALVEEMSAAAASLRQQAEALVETVSAFQLPPAAVRGQPRLPG